MNEKKSQKEPLSHKELYRILFDQLMNLAAKYALSSPVLRNENRFDEDLSVVKRQESCVFLFTTKEFNPAFPGSSDGSYPNKFTFNFEEDVMSFSYFEAVPYREQGRKFNVLEMSEEDFRNDVLPHFISLNNLFQYFNLPDRIKIPH